MATTRQQMRDDVLRNLDRQIFIVRRKEEAFNKLPPEYRDQYSALRLAALKKTAENLSVARQRLNIIKASADDSLFSEEIGKVKAAIATYEQELSEVSPLKDSDNYPGLANAPWKQARVAERLMRNEFSPDMDVEEQAGTILKRMELVGLEKTKEYAEIKEALESFITLNDYYKQVVNDSAVADRERISVKEQAQKAYYELRAKSHQAFAVLLSVNPGELEKLNKAIPDTVQDPSEDVNEIRGALISQAIAEFMLAEIKASPKGVKDPDYVVWQEELASAQKELKKLRQKYGVKVDSEKEAFSLSEELRLATTPSELQRFIRAQEMMLDKFDLIVRSHDNPREISQVSVDPDFDHLRKRFLKDLNALRSERMKLSGSVDDRKSLVEAIFNFKRTSATVKDIITNNSLNLMALKQIPEQAKTAELWGKVKIAEQAHDKFLALDPHARFDILITLPVATKEFEDTKKRKKILYPEGRSKSFENIFANRFTESQVNAFLAKDLDTDLLAEENEFKTVDDFPPRSAKELLETRLKALQKAQKGKDQKEIEKAKRNFADASEFLWLMQVQYHTKKGDLHSFLAKKSAQMTSSEKPKKKWYTAAWEWLTSRFTSKPAPSADTRKIEQRLSTATHNVHSQEESKHAVTHYSVFHPAKGLQKEKALILDLHDRVHRMPAKDEGIVRNLNRIEELYNRLSASADRIAMLSEYRRKNPNATDKSDYEVQAQADYRELQELLPKVKGDLAKLEPPQPPSRKNSEAELKEEDEGEGEGVKARKKSR